MPPPDAKSPADHAIEIIENPQTIADMFRNGLTIGVLRHEDHEGVAAMYKVRDEAHKNGGWEVLRTTVDFPITIASDDAEDEAVVYECDEQAFVERTHKIMRMVPNSPVQHQRRFVFLSDHLVLNLEENHVAVGQETLHFKAAHLVVKKDGAWKVKMVVEGGWGRAAKLTGATFNIRVKGT